MPKKQMTFDTVLKRNHHKNILTLLELFESHFDPSVDNKGKAETIGLRPYHFRFALMEDPKLSEPVYERVKEFFDERSPRDFENFYKNGMLMRGSIDTPQKLSNHLHILVDMDLIETHRTKSFVNYRLTEKYYIEKMKKRIIEQVKSSKNKNELYKIVKMFDKTDDLFENPSGTPVALDAEHQ